MPRNSSGTYSLPLPPYVAGTTITSAAMNTNLSDVASALTLSVATTGVSSMTGPLKLAAGTLGAPSLTYAADLTTGFYNSAAGSTTYVASGVATAVFSAAGLAITGTLSVIGSITFTGNLAAAQATFTHATNPLILKNSSNDVLEHTFTTWGLGSGAGDVYGVTGLGTGANDVTQVRHYIGATEIYRFTATTFTSQIASVFSSTVTVGTKLVLNDGYETFTEIATPAAPAATKINLYNKTSVGPAWLDSSNAERLIAPSGAIIGRAYAEQAPTSYIPGTIPIDNTAPQIGEGTQLISVSYTVKQSTSRIRIRLDGFVSWSIDNSVFVCALFSSASASAIQITSHQQSNDSSGERTVPLPMEYEYAPGAAGALTFSVRIGVTPDSTIQIAQYATANLGSVGRITLVVEEISQ